MTELARWGEDKVNEVAYSPNAQLLAGGTSIRVYLYDTQTREAMHILKRNESVESIAFSPNGESVAVASDNNVQLWRITPSGGQLMSVTTLREAHISGAY